MADVDVGSSFNETGFYQLSGSIISRRIDEAGGFPIHVVAGVPYMAEDGAIGLSFSYRTLVFLDPLSKGAACLSKILEVAGGTRDGVSANCRGICLWRGVDQTASQRVGLTEDKFNVAGVERALESFEFFRVRET